MGRIRVLAACANVVFRRGLVQTLRETSHIEVIQETGDGVEAIRLASQFHPDMVLVGNFVERMTSIELIRQLKEIDHSILVLACSGTIDMEHILSLLQGGADGYLLETSKPEVLIAAISTAYMGESILDPLVLRALLEEVPVFSKKLEKRPSSRVSDKELEVMKLAAQGMRNKEIAGNLNMSVSTVKAHWANIFTKLGVSSRTQGVFHAIRDGLLSPEEIRSDRLPEGRTLQG